MCESMTLFFNAQSHHFEPNLRKPFLCSVKRTHFSQLCQPSTENLPPDHGLILVGGSKLSGHVNISGSKNSALAILAGTLCCSKTSKLHNIPDISDTREMFSILQSLGVRVEASNGEVTVDTDGIRSVEPCPESVRQTRGGFFVVGPLLARFGEAVVALPGGCDIGTRPIDLYIRGLQALGAVVELRDGKVCAFAVNGKRLVGGKFHLDYPSVGATETLMMAASMADGVTTLCNVAQEPEVVDLAWFLNKSGACVEGEGSDTLVIKGRNQLHGPEFTIIPDRIEAGTFMVAAAITRSCVSMSPVIPFHLSCVIDKLSAAGCKIIETTQNTLEISALPGDIARDIRGVHVKTGPFPQFPTDLQPQIMALLMTRNGSSIVEESVFDKRMGHVRELQKLGGRIQVCGNTAFIKGQDHGSALYGTTVCATNLRGGAALILAGMAAEGITKIDGVAHIDRGYQNLDMKLCSLGANIRRLISLPVCQA
ncbi:UDP-N-acetylglucosamine 1-carboxyvinyltransferase-like isoform X1 [Macadamia integrifolia]|uniref:UDP-N-acetylglucosamine 1-carboxyvinyltransferase-like isoform X1 n=1 Tax=Macadamia integrifolia TaxID=60698 RepID=UPI001C4EFD56|nr:UDP-N-acetylglucosamine 1-carboxyvinyltransferase-like isoform X1 [Macadamia integrifolia]